MTSIVGAMVQEQGWFLPPSLDLSWRNNVDQLETKLWFLLHFIFFLNQSLLKNHIKGSKNVIVDIIGGQMLVQRMFFIKCIFFSFWKGQPNMTDKNSYAGVLTRPSCFHRIEANSPKTKTIWGCWLATILSRIFENLLNKPSSTTAARQVGSRRIPITNIFHHIVDIAFDIFEALWVVSSSK